MAENVKRGNPTRATINRRCRVYTFFHGRDDKFKVLLPFLKDGIGG